MAPKSKKSLKIAMLATRWAALGDLGVMLRHVGGKIVTKSARMSQHSRQGANPPGFEVRLGPPDGNAPMALAPCDARRDIHPGSRSLH